VRMTNAVSATAIRYCPRSAAPEVHNIIEKPVGRITETFAFGWRTFPVVRDSVLECASVLALSSWLLRRATKKRQDTGALQNAIAHNRDPKESRTIVVGLPSKQRLSGFAAGSFVRS